ncbi:MAG: 30S ribosomal protein S18 [Deltaproteobacteria bacterium]|nr:30S ribosomal protein S18 [Deltaproteobacteria bacterium]
MQMGGKKRKSRRPIKKKPLRVDMAEINYKNLRFLQQFVSERGKIVPRRVSNVSAESQRALSLAIRQARQLAFLPFASNHNMVHRAPGGSYAGDSARGHSATR